MSEEQKQILQQSLWAIANLLRGKMNPDDYRDYILGFIFFKYLSEKQNIYVTELLQGEDETDFKKVTDTETLEALREECLIKLGYYLESKELFEAIAEKGNNNIEGESNFILDDLQAVLNHIEQSTMGNESEDDFAALF
jgi:type I restriction enzyme M protein